MVNVSEATYQAICEAILKCATNCYFKGAEGLIPAAQAIEEEYKQCTDELYKLLSCPVKILPDNY